MSANAIVLIGPTGAGKTPLGAALEAGGLGGRRLAHFDFGANLRALAAAAPDDRFSAADIAFVRDVLDRGALLEDKDFPLAARLLDRFVAARALGDDGLLLLNGLPRHAGQAAALAHRVRWRALVELDCPADVVHERLRRDSGGDRAERTDDAPERVHRKLALYAARTAPLCAWFAARRVPHLRLPVRVADTGADLAARLAEMWP